MVARTSCEGDIGASLESVKEMFIRYLDGGIKQSGGYMAGIQGTGQECTCKFESHQIIF